MFGGVVTADAAPAAWLPGLVPLQSDSGDNTLVFVLFFVIGLVVVYSGFRQWQQMRLIQDTPTEKVRSAAVGRTELSGSAEPIEGEGTIPQPFTGGQALVATYKVEEWEEDHDPDDHGRDGHWSTIDSGTMYKPFALDDGTGRMRVEPEPAASFHISDEHRNRFLVGPGETPPDGVVEFFERQYDDDGLLGRLLGGGAGRPRLRQLPVLSGSDPARRGRVSARRR